VTSHSNSQAQYLCVLPFKASPDAIYVLRRAVRTELALWGLAGVADDTELVVTELATNVIRHVGLGSAAALILTCRADVIRIEVHDSSHRIPSLAQPGYASECGRGLHLLSAVARSWGTRITAFGKAVWCDMSRPESAECVRVRRASLVLNQYRDLVPAEAAPLLSRPKVQEERAAALIVDLLHWLNSQGCDPSDVLDCAQLRYEADLEAAA